NNLSLPNVIALGEIGLDRRNGADFSLQKKFLTQQLAIIKDLNIPVIIHCVKAYSDLIPFIKKNKNPFVLHQFNGNKTQLSDFMKFDNVWFSFGKDLIFDNQKVVSV